MQGLLLIAKLSDVSPVSLGASGLQFPALGPPAAPDSAVAAFAVEIGVGATLRGVGPGTPSSGLTVFALAFATILTFALSLATVFAFPTPS